MKKAQTNLKKKQSKKSNIQTTRLTEVLSDIEEDFFLNEPEPNTVLPLLRNNKSIPQKQLKMKKQVTFQGSSGGLSPPKFRRFDSILLYDNDYTVSLPPSKYKAEALYGEEGAKVDPFFIPKI